MSNITHPTVFHTLSKTVRHLTRKIAPRCSSRPSTAPSLPLPSPFAFIFKLLVQPAIPHYCKDPSQDGLAPSSSSFRLPRDPTPFMLDVMNRRKPEATQSPPAPHQPLHVPHLCGSYDAAAMSSYASLQQQLHQQQQRQHVAAHRYSDGVHAPLYHAQLSAAEAHSRHFQQQQQFFRQAAAGTSASSSPPLRFATAGAPGGTNSPVVRATGTAPCTESPPSLPGISSMLRRPTSSAGLSSAPPSSSAHSRLAVLPPRGRSESTGSIGSSAGMVLSPADLYTGSNNHMMNHMNNHQHQLPPPSDRWTSETRSISPNKSVSPLHLAPPQAITTHATVMNTTGGSAFYGTLDSRDQSHQSHQQQSFQSRKRPAPTSVDAIDRAHIRSPSLRHSASSLDDLQSFSSAESSANSTPRGDSDDLLQLANGYVATATAAASANDERIANPNKNSRYLREMDRREILSRIEQGEKQATLAKEYQVSRAAICNLNKHRDEVMSRKDENPLAKHPKKPRPKAFKVKIRVAKAAASKGSSHKLVPSPRVGSGGSGGAGGTGRSPAVHEVKSRAAALLLTSVRNKNTSLREFQRASERLVRLVLEDALALVPIKAVEVFLSDAVKADGVGYEHPPCAVSMETSGRPLLHLFRVIEPEQPTARLSVTGVDDTGVQLEDENDTAAVSLPPSLQYHNVFVLAVSAASADAICRVVQALQARGAVDAMISLVVLFISSETIRAVRARFPCVKIVAAQIDPSGKQPPSPAGVGTRDADGDEASSAVQHLQEPPCCLDLVLDRFRQVYL